MLLSMVRLLKFLFLPGKHYFYFLRGTVIVVDDLNVFQRQHCGTRISAEKA